MFKVLQKKGYTPHKIRSLTSYARTRLLHYPLAWINRRLALMTNIVGISGSAGKTTTKDICSAMLSEFNSTGATLQSKNDRFDVVRTLLRLRWSQRYFLVEMSGAKPGQLDYSMSLVKPDIGVLTNIGRDHYKAFKSIESIAEEKAKIVRQLPKKGVAVLNMDDPNVRAIGESWPHYKIWVGRREDATIRLIDTASQWPDPLTLTVEYEKKTYEVETNLYGEHMALSVLCALGVAVALKLPMDKAIAGIRKANPAEGRMQIVQGEDGVVFIRDDWKAPDWSLDAPIEFLKEANAERKVAIIGTISDFSTDSSSKYKQIARRVMEAADLTVFVGPNAHRAVRARKEPDDGSLLGFERIIDAARFLKHELRIGDLVLLKGSARADHLARLLYDRYQPVQCWVDQCGRKGFCHTCPKLYQSLPDSAESLLDRPAPINDTIASDAPWGDPSGKATIIVGLGNTGAKYEKTPHNIGHIVLDKLADRTGRAWRECPEGLVSSVELALDTTVLLFKASAKMNQSGVLVRKFLQEQGGHPQKCILVHDDMDLTIGEVRLKFDGSSAGHNGVKSILAELGSNSITRVRVGVRSDGYEGGALHRVLATFRPEDLSRVEESVTKALELVAEASMDAGRKFDKAAHFS